MIIEVEGKQVILDDDQKERFTDYKIKLHNDYPYVQMGHKPFYVHHLIIGKAKGMDVDHINGNKLDNRRENLRLITHQQNLYNRKSLNKNNSSGVNGVTWHKQSEKWQAQARINGKHIQLGTYRKLEDAIAARKKYEQENMQHLIPSSVVSH